MQKSTKISEQQVNNIKKTPLFFYMGEKDCNCQVDIVKFSLRRIKEIYTNEDGKVSRNFSFQTEVNMGHYISDLEVKLLRKWIKKTMNR